MIDRFRIPPFLLPIYQAAGIEYGVRWEVLAAINEIETDYGRNLNVSLRGRRRLDAVHAGHLEAVRRRRQQATASRTRTTRSTRSSPPRATCAPPAPTPDIARAIFAYNHADWYVDSVLLRAKVLGGLPSNFVGSLTGLDAGPLPGPREGDLRRRHLRGAGRQPQAQAQPVVARAVQRDRRGINIYAAPTRR